VQQTGNLDRSIEAFEKASHAQEKLGSLWHAAKHMETCGTLSKDVGAWPKVPPPPPPPRPRTFATHIQGRPSSTQ
jgi:hypothetical protein